MSDISIVLVDDDPMISRLYGAAVARMGFQAATANSGEEAIDLVREFNPALVISDVQMPGMGGFDFVATLKEQSLKTMPVLYLTGYDDIEIIRGGLRAGGDDFLIKGMPIITFTERATFWMGSGFTGLPDEIRRRALIAAVKSEGDTLPPVRECVQLDESILKSVESQIRKELKKAMNEGREDVYCTRQIDRILFLGRLSKLILEFSPGFGDLIRFPDYVLRIVMRLKLPWRKEVPALLKYYPLWEHDIRFIRAGVEPLASFTLLEDSLAFEDAAGL